MMATVTVPLTSYKVTLGRQIEVSGGKYYALVECNASDGHLYLIYFTRPDSITPPNFYNPATKRGAAFIPYDLYPTYVDLLRNEKPLNIYLNSDKPEWNQLLTGTEPVGEGE
jgi:hypothetical protein